MTEDTTTDVEERKNAFRVISGGKDVEGGTDENPSTVEIPQNEYIVTDINGHEHYAEGFLLFTSHHIAIMRDTGAGALPVFVMPLDNVFSAELVEDDEVFDGEVVEVL